MVVSVFIKLFNMSVTATWIALAVIVLRFLLRKAPKAISVFMWGLVALRLMLPFSIESALSLIPSAETVPPDIVYSEEPVIHSGIPIINSTVNPIISESLSPEVGNSVNPMQVVSAVAANLWVLGMVLMLLYTLFSYVRIKRRVREAAILKENIWQCDGIDTPFILGVFKPRVYLPSSISDEDAKYVIAHEKAHLKRRDHFWKPLGFLLLTVYWFNPVLWLAYILLCRDIEQASDEKVIKLLGEQAKKPYSEALINCSMPRKAISACPLAFGESGVKERVKNVLNYKKASFWIIIIAVVSCVALAIVFLTNPSSDDEISSDTDDTSSEETVVIQPNEIDIEELKKEYPEYFGFSPTDTLRVYIWQMSADSYSCGVINTREIPDYPIYSGIAPPVNVNSIHESTLRYSEKVWNLKPTSIAEMHAILAYSMVPTENIKIFPIVQPHSSYHYEVTDQYIDNVKELFWVGVNSNVQSLRGNFSLPFAEVSISSVKYSEDGIHLGLLWSLNSNFTEAASTEYPKYHLKITVGDNSKFTSLPLPDKLEKVDDRLHNYVVSTYHIDLPAKDGDDISFDLYLNDDKTFISNIFKTHRDDSYEDSSKPDLENPISYTDFDVDGDGETERISLGLVSTSDPYTFSVSVQDSKGEICKSYRNTFITTDYVPQRLKVTAGQNKCELECVAKDGDGYNYRYYKLELDGYNIVLRYGEETFGYWGKQG